jgi:hypothetical protein
MLARKSKQNSSSIISYQNSLKNRRDKLFKKHSYLESEYGKYEHEEFKSKFKSVENWMVFIDVFCAIADLITVTWMYFDHFEYNRQFGVTDSMNYQRFICLAISFVVCILLVIRTVKRKVYETLKYLLSMRNSGKLYIL